MTKYHDAEALKDHYAKEIDNARNDHNNAKTDSQREAAEEREAHNQQQYDRVNTTSTNEKNWNK